MDDQGAVRYDCNGILAGSFHGRWSCSGGGGTLFVSSLLRPSNPYPAKNMPYECGMDAAGEAAGGRLRVQFFILAILLVVFDVEAMFLFPWAVVLKEIGLVGYVEMFVFMLLLSRRPRLRLAEGALEWEA